MNNWINKEVVLAVLRHVIGALGGILVAKGFLTPDQSGQLGSWILSPATQGAALVGIAVIHSVFQKHTVAADHAKEVSALKGMAAALPAQSANSAAKTSLTAGVVALFLCLSTLASRGASTNAAIVPATAPAPAGLSLPSLNLPGLALNSGIPTNAVAIANDLAPFFEKLIPSLTNKNVAIDIAGLYSDGDAGFEATMEYLASTNFAFGFGPEYLNGWYVNAGSATLGGYVPVPVIGQLHLGIVTSLSIRTKDAAIGNETATEYYRPIDLYQQKIWFAPDFRTGFNTIRSKMFYGGSVRFWVNFD